MGYRINSRTIKHSISIGIEDDKLLLRLMKKGQYISYSDCFRDLIRKRATEALANGE